MMRMGRVSGAVRVMGQRCDGEGSALWTSRETPINEGGRLHHEGLAGGALVLGAGHRCDHHVTVDHGPHHARLCLVRVLFVRAKRTKRPMRSLRAAAAYVRANAPPPTRTT